MSEGREGEKITCEEEKGLRPRTPDERLQQLRDNIQTQRDFMDEHIERKKLKPGYIPPTPPTPTKSIPARHCAVLGDLSSAGEVIQCNDLTNTITSHGVVYYYCGVSDGIGYYRTREQIREIEETIREGYV